METENTESTENTETIEYTMGLGLVNLLAFVMLIPVLIILLLPFLGIWDFDTFKIGMDAFFGNYFLIILIGGIIVHELLHGFTMGYFASDRMKSIKFGFKALTFYTHCKEPLKVKHYKIGAAMPLIVLGIIPALIAFLLGNGFILSFGIFFTWAAGGDIIALFMLRKLDNEVYVSDHPKKMGFIREVDQEENAI